ncbi:hypothetical protein VP1G_10069 [Cytospora mali]|uniref:Uncharacterized protein n=1 Tax=Cytospora mali TaxID=578113 RepID=A0A194VG09_CYTMA|nr:hypothetical protein VP1G_10069 [Valsa mali var. pyri (nom. inval.)]
MANEILFPGRPDEHKRWIYDCVVAKHPESLELPEQTVSKHQISTDGTVYIVHEIYVDEITQQPYARQNEIIFNHRSLIVENYKAVGFSDLRNLRYIAFHMTGDDELDQEIDNAVAVLGEELEFRSFTPVQLTKARNADL